MNGTPSPSAQLPSASPFPFTWGQEIKFTGGKYNGFLARVRWCGEHNAEVVIGMDGKEHPVIEETKFMSATEKPSPRPQS